MKNKTGLETMPRRKEDDQVIGRSNSNWKNMIYIKVMRVKFQQDNEFHQGDEFHRADAYHQGDKFHQDYDFCNVEEFHHSNESS